MAFHHVGKDGLDLLTSWSALLGLPVLGLQVWATVPGYKVICKQANAKEIFYHQTYLTRGPEESVQYKSEKQLIVTTKIHLSTQTIDTIKQLY